MKNINLFTAILLLLLIALARWDFVYQKKVRFETFNKIILALASHRLSPGKRGVVKLPHEWAKVTDNGKVYVNYDHGAMMILFPTWQGKDCNLNGYLYVTTPLAPSKFWKNYYGQTSIDYLVGDRIPGDSGEPIDIVVEQKVSTHWYHVSRALD